MVNYGQIWSIMVKCGKLWSIMVNSGNNEFLFSISGRNLVLGHFGLNWAIFRYPEYRIFFLLTESHWRKNNAWEKIPIFWVPKNGSNWPKMAQNQNSTWFWKSKLKNQKVVTNTDSFWFVLLDIMPSQINHNWYLLPDFDPLHPPLVKFGWPQYANKIFF